MKKVLVLVLVLAALASGCVSTPTVPDNYVATVDGIGKVYVPKSSVTKAGGQEVAYAILGAATLAMHYDCMTGHSWADGDLPKIPPKESNAEKAGKYACQAAAEKDQNTAHASRMADIGDTLAITGATYKPLRIEPYQMQTGSGDGYYQQQMLNETRNQTRLMDNYINNQNTQYFMGRVGR